MESLKQAENDFKIIKKGTLTGGSTANTNVLSQISGTILEIPIREVVRLLKLIHLAQVQPSRPLQI